LKFELRFDIWSKTNNCAAAAIVEGSGRRIWGVIYEIPDWLISRSTSGSRKSLDAIEGEGTNYSRMPIVVRDSDGREFPSEVQTYIGRKRRQGIRTSLEYVTYILEGIKEHKMPSEYAEYVIGQIVANHPELAASLVRC
jgi:hypothetical protein